MKILICCIVLFLSLSNCLHHFICWLGFRLFVDACKYLTSHGVPPHMQDLVLSFRMITTKGRKSQGKEENRLFFPDLSVVASNTL